MNWTGGRLSRHSRRADSSTTSKQKQHFAKMRSHFMSGSVKKGPAKPPSFDMAAPQPPDELSVGNGTIRTKPQQPLAPLSRELHSYHGLYGENKYSGRVENSRHERPGYPGLRDMPQRSIRSYETKPEPISTIEPVDGGYEIQDDMEAIRRKRFRILREGDWLGLSIQRPLQLKYMESESRDAIGKRRKLNPGNEAQYSRVQDKIASPFAPNRHIPREEIFPKPDHNQPQIMQYRQTPDAKGSVRIFIDGRERHVRESSGSVVNRPHPEYVQSPLSSDVMLLDLEVGGSRQRPLDQLSSEIVNGTKYIPKTVDDGRQGSEEKSISSFGDYPSSGPLIHQIIAPNRNIYAPSLQQRSSPIFAMGSTKTNWPGASPVIYQPTPKSSTTSQLLRSYSSTFEDSIAATAGRKDTVTASVAQDEEMWRSWLVTESDDEEPPTWPVDDQSDELAPDGPNTSADATQSIPPRLSSTDQSGQNDESGQGRDPVPSIPNFISSATGSPDDENLGNHNMKRSLETVRTSKPHGPANDGIQLPTEPQKWKPKDKNQDSAWEAFVLTEPSENLVDLVAEPQKQAAQEDPDAAWKKFILSSDYNDGNTTGSTENEAESRTSTSRKKFQRSSSKTSLQVHPAEIVIRPKPRLEHSSDATAARVVYKPSTHTVPSRSQGRERSGNVSGTSMYSHGSARTGSQTSRYFPQATGKPLKRVVNKQRNSEDPLARYMPLQSPSERDIFMAKEANIPARNESFERELDDSLKQALHLGRRYAKQEKERYAKHGNEAYEKQGNGRHAGHARQEKESYAKKKSKESRDIYDIPISDDTEGVDSE
ncbi:hypothetical protein VE03_05779 [Pseudogymnoascus sp. 23342-1-I1]|nr:hypothetical protein VE03_05779 [Pseudogymnoascus sp. 23342-1-I1]